MKSKLKIDRRTVLTGVAALGTVTLSLTLLPYAARAASNRGNSFPTVSGEIKVPPVFHASFVMKTPSGVVYNDPVGAYIRRSKPYLTIHST